MKKTAPIASVETTAGFQEHLVEKFVQQNLPPKRDNLNRTTSMGSFGRRYRDIESCAAELPVHGTIEIFMDMRKPAGIRRLSVPVASRFIVFCVRDEQEDYKVAWSSSLS